MMLQKFIYLFFFSKIKNLHGKSLIILWHIHWNSPASPNISRDKNSIKRENQRSLSQVLLLGLPTWPKQQGMFFALFLDMYWTTVLGNLLIILLIKLDSCLPIPRYLFPNSWLFMAFPFHLSQFQKCSWTYRLSNNLCPMLGAFLRFFFS